MALSPREIVERYVAAINSLDFEALRDLVHPEFEEIYPQSGERVRGIDNIIAIFRNYPQGGLKPGDTGAVRIIGGEDRWAMSPTFTILRVAGEGDVLTVITRARYPDDSIWHLVAVSEFEDGKLRRSTRFFAQAFEAPEWRRQWVELMGDETMGPA